MRLDLAGRRSRVAIRDVFKSGEPPQRRPFTAAREAEQTVRSLLGWIHQKLSGEIVQLRSKPAQKAAGSSV